MKMRTIKHFLAACFLLVFATSIHAQEQGTKTYLPKFAIKTNALYWATSTPNLGFEVALAKKLTLDVSGNYNPWKFSKDKSSTGWYNLNSATGFANVSTVVFSVSMAIMPMLT